MSTSWDMLTYFCFPDLIIFSFFDVLLYGSVKAIRYFDNISFQL